MKKFRDRVKDRQVQEGIVSEIVGRWMVIGMCVGIVVGAMTDNVGLWLAVGLCIGVAVGSAKNDKKKKEMAETKRSLKDRIQDE